MPHILSTLFYLLKGDYRGLGPWVQGLPSRVQRFSRPATFLQVIIKAIVPASAGGARSTRIGHGM